jgi:ATP-dependent protease ClpP protease subunit
MPHNRGQGSGVRGQGSEVRVQGRGFSIRAEADRAEILIYDVIDPWYGISAKQFHDQLKALGKVSTIDVRINSPGGSITEGIALHSILKRQSAKVIVHVDGIAASIASVVAMAASEIVMAAGSYMMIHNPLGVVVGEADEMREYAELLDKMKAQVVNIYAARTKQSAEAVAAFMDAETWFTPDEAIAAGFADRTSPQLAIAASLDPTRFSHLPLQLRQLRGEALMSTESATVASAPPALPQPAAYGDLKAGLPGADPAFLCAQLEANATLPAAQAVWMAEQSRRLTAAREEGDQAKTALAARKSGIEPLGDGVPKPATAGGGDPIAQFNDLVAAKVAAGKKKPRAVSDVIAENPELHGEYLATYNAERKRN